MSGVPEGRSGVRAYEELTPHQLMTNRFHLACLAVLVPYHQRPAALDAWLAVDPSLFFMGFDPPAPVTEAVLRLGGTRLQTALARTAGSADTQRALAGLGVRGIDAALLDNHRLSYETRCLLQLRDPAAAAAGAAYHPDHHRRALCSADPDLAAAALLDRRGEHPPTARAAAWETVRTAGGTARVRELVALLPGGGDPGGGDGDACGDCDVDAGVRAACAEADPGPYLDSAAELRLGTGALLRRLGAVHRAGATPPEVRRTMRSVLREPYRIDWRLVSAARLGHRLPRTAAEVLRSHPDCPPEVAVVLRTGRPAVPGRPLPPPDPGPEAPPPYRQPESHWVPPWQPPGDTGPFGGTAESALRVLRTTAVVHDAHRDPHAPHLGHLSAVLEHGRLSASEAAPLIRPASLLTSWVGQQSGWADVSRAPWSGRSALHVETAALVARWCAGGVPAERWAAFVPRLWHYPGTLPELLAELSAVPDRHLP
ncbi:hypothetical protein LG634_06390 [Streptomyces bambusae]|uniref:hypothetical protein n=1 Tax=Streptomyces bambusae TaxID=1550616 RepID=UPI001CFD6702|nr:hypothetical protein [Streptomyces bambusae]MCB5164464.1 hypothetical protein [Streptomyces bambusae]